MKVCEALSSRFDLHMLNRSGDVRSCVIADYEAAGSRPDATGRRTSGRFSTTGAATFACSNSSAR